MDRRLKVLNWTDFNIKDLSKNTGSIRWVHNGPSAKIDMFELNCGFKWGYDGPEELTVLSYLDEGTGVMIELIERLCQDKCFVGLWDLDKITAPRKCPYKKYVKDFDMLTSKETNVKINNKDKSQKRCSNKEIK